MKKIMMVSGYFNPLHVGHLDMIEAGRSRADLLLVIVNNDQQQMLKKGKIIMPEQDRLRIAKALRSVDIAMLSIDTELPQGKTLELIASKLYPNDELHFGQGGDRSAASRIPPIENEMCKKYNITQHFDLGLTKPDSSSRINKELGLEV